MTGCSVGDSPRAPFCTVAPTRTYRIGCIHEHVTDSPVCEPHAARVEQTPGICGPCLEADGHYCYVVILGEVIVTDSGETRVLTR